MQNKWLTYGFLFLMVTALVTLAVLQYQWLGSVSDAEKERLEESLLASSENFVADFNRPFTQLSQTFKIQLSDRNEDMAPLIGRSYQNWMNGSDHSGILNSIYYLEHAEGDEATIFAYKSVPEHLTEIEPDEEVKNWVANNYNPTANQKRMPLRGIPKFGSATFLAIPVQALDILNLSEKDFGQNVQVKLSVDQLNDIVLLKLDNDFIKDEFIPKIASTYFTESYSDQYQLSIIKGDTSKYVYYSSGSYDDIPKPDVVSNIDRFNFANIVMINTDNSSLESVSLAKSADSLELNFIERGVEEFSRTDTQFAHGARISSHFYTGLTSSSLVEENKAWSVESMGETEISASFIGSMASSSWEFWLTHKDGSLEAFVSKTRNKNLGISFGILFILGISGAMIVIFTQRSKVLSDQQMLFVAGVSHELRTPLSVIRSAAENLSEGVVQTEERKQEYAKLMLKEGRRLSDMVDQIMEFSGIQSGKRIYHFNHVDVDSFVESIKEEFLPHLEEQSVNLEYFLQTNSESIYADWDALFLSVSNLIQNAIKFRGTSSKVLLKVDDVSYRGQKPFAFRYKIMESGFQIKSKKIFLRHSLEAKNQFQNRLEEMELV